MKLPIELQTKFEAIQEHGDIALLQKETGLKYWGNMADILKGKQGTAPKRIAIIKKFIQKREKLIKQINENE